MILSFVNKILPYYLFNVNRHFATHNNSVSILQQHYNRLKIRKKYIRAIKRGTLVWDRGQVKIPPIKAENYDPPKYCLLPNEKHKKGQYKGRFENLTSKKVSFYD
ncbi:conserved hypothetical protein [Theileria orientalis strain Shintoku]|uniref:Uncharacterized protein n=1 Tax=Theileria orientalis strain Shintoku TaxID=869250 RepID=J4C411_THEOR|nr:conserved hypothetical protein [Theileria orientalis strain Shintoku]PVC50913.1 hypothetical protein MACL_00001926 [Theileria orientalis]BAM41376.1 conserved hypothetical protein [Theileria orientalis strain Shintoku]|eukprot:XP_009691677.1 conserved hypothetical protein [Theileria orientalis strain Shintoku]